MEHTYTIDFETTGVDPKTCEPVEVALFSPNVMALSRYIKPSTPIPPETSAVHHITDEDVDQADPWATVRSDIASILSFPEGHSLPILVAHNAEYEKEILLRNPEGCVDFPAVIWVCTYKCALRIWPDAPAHKNEVLRYFLGLNNPPRGRASGQQPHSALHDCMVTYALLTELLKHATMEDLVKWTELPAQLPKMPFGKHYGKKWSEIDRGYLTWILNQSDMREDVKFCAHEELRRRR